MLGPMTTALIALLVPYVVGVLTKWLTNLAKASETFAASGNGLKRLVVVLIAAVLTGLFAWAGVHVPGTPFAAGAGELTQLAQALLTGLSALVSAIYAMVAHTGDKVATVAPTAFMSTPRSTHDDWRRPPIG